jgi:putative tryptophan/tyrosine transport system substrate-binding protein
LNRSGGDITGVTSLNTEVVPKRLELLHELVLGAPSFGLLVNPTNPKGAEATTEELQAAARALALQVHVLNASTETDFDQAFTHSSNSEPAGS